MSRWPLWAVLAPGEPARLKSRAYAALCLEEDEEDEDGPPFELIPGNDRYHALVGANPIDVGAEIQIAEELSLECDESVYSIERANDPWTVMSWRNGTLEVLEVDPESLAKSLGCPLPGREKSSDLPATKPLRTVALLAGVQAAEAYPVLEENYGTPLSPERYHLEDTPRGLLLAGGASGMNFAHIILSERFPHATVYGVTASPRFDIFFVTVLRGAEGIEQFTRPLRPDPCVPEVSEIKGERSPERILAALGIPPEWFRNE
jgi:hypothetical protein